MVEFDLVQKQAKVRVWFDELPYRAPPSAEVAEISLPADSRDGRQNRCLAVEFFIHMGGYCPYGLLGGEFVPQESQSLVVQALLATGSESRFHESLAETIDEASWGLPREHVSGVLEGAVAAGADRLLGAGLLRFDCAAHGIVGSSINHFKELVWLFLQLIDAEIETVTEERLLTLLERLQSERSANRSKSR